MCGLRSEATQKHLLSKSDLTLKRALEIAQSQEAAERNTQKLKEGDTSTLSVESVTVSSKKRELPLQRKKPFALGVPVQGP